MLEISKEAKAKLNSSILVSGSARSGTTIVGKIIHSLSDVEYCFEPPVLFSLFSLINTMPADQWKLLYETYLYEEFYINALAGRSINCNHSDDSSIYRVKSEEDVNERLSKSMGKLEAETHGANSVIAYKMPDIVSRIPLLLNYYPSTRVVIVNRGPVETLNSLINKEWFTEENANSNLLWPFAIYNGKQIPFWVSEEDHADWDAMSPLERAAYYYIEITRNIPKISNRIDINYDKLVADPLNTVKILADTLGLNFGPKTEEIISTIKPTTPNRDEDILDKLSPDMKEKVLNATEAA